MLMAQCFLAQYPAISKHLIGHTAILKIQHFMHLFDPGIHTHEIQLLMISIRFTLLACTIATMK